MCGRAIGYGPDVCGFRGAQVFAYDLATCTLAARRPLPCADALPNDVVVHGDWAYVTDSDER